MVWDKNYDRLKKYYDLVTNGIGYSTDNLEKIINAMYEKRITDEFLRPIILDNNSLIKNGDVLIWLNYRTDRAKEILSAFTNKEFQEFKTHNMDNLEIYSFFEIDDNIEVNCFLKEDDVKNTLGIYLSKLGLTQEE